MKRIKQMVALMIAAIMVLAMGMTTLAASDQKTITISNPTKGHVYTAYQVLKGEKVGAELTKLDWGNGITEKGKTDLKVALGFTTGNATVAQVAEALSKITDADRMDEIAQILGDNIAGNGNPLVSSGSAVTATVDQGYYVVVDTEGTGAADNTTFSKYMVQVVGDVTIQTKAKTTTSQKTVKDEENAMAKFTEANIGEVRTFYLAATLPDDYAAYSAFYMNFKDTMNHMDYVKIEEVTVRRDVKIVNGIVNPTSGDVIQTITQQTGTDKINGYELTAPNPSTAGSVTDVDTNNLSVEFKDLKQIYNGAQAGDCVVVAYQAKLNSTAVIKGSNINEFQLVFSNDPNSTVVPKPGEELQIPTGITPPDKAEVYTTEIELTKIDGTTKDILTGAEFTLTGETHNVVIKTATVFTVDANGEYWKLKNDTFTKDKPTVATKDHYVDETTKYAPKVKTEVKSDPSGSTKNIKAEVGKDGKVVFSGLGEGEYTLEETKAPVGYNKMTPIKFKITFDRGTHVFNVSGGLGSLAANIENFSGSTLPSTGGIGTTIFYIVGGVLVVGAGILLITKKRMNEK